jgi:tetratricopeptide (TPR) repeat protein
MRHVTPLAAALWATILLTPACEEEKDAQGNPVTIDLNKLNEESAAQVKALVTKITAGDPDIWSVVPTVTPQALPATDPKEAVATGTAQAQKPSGPPPNIPAAAVERWKAAVNAFESDAEDIKTAEAELAAVTRDHPDFMLAWYSLGTVRMRRGDKTVDGRAYEQSLAAFLRAAELAWEQKSEATGVYNNLAVALRKVGRSDETVPILSHAIVRDPRSTYTLNNLAEVWMLYGEKDKARRLLKYAKVLKPDDGLTRRNLIKLDAVPAE